MAHGHRVTWPIFLSFTDARFEFITGNLEENSAHRERIQKCKWQSYLSRNTNLFSFLQKDWFAVRDNTTDIKKETSFTQKNLLIVSFHGWWSFKGTIRQKNCLNISKITVEYSFSYDLLPSYGTFSLTLSWLFPNWSFISPQGTRWECMETIRTVETIRITYVPSQKLWTSLLHFQGREHGFVMSYSMSFNISTFVIS